MNKSLWCALLGVAGTFLTGCGQPSQPVAVTPTSGTPSGVIAVPAETPAKTVQVKAGKGSGKQGRSLDQHEGIYVTPIKALFSTKEYLAYDVAVKHALDLHKAYYGNAPKTHEEFMEKIIKTKCST